VSIRRHVAALCAVGAMAFAACSGNGGSAGSGAGSGDAGSGPVAQCTDCTPTGAMTFALPSPAGVTLWTTTTMDKVLREAAPPPAKGDHVEVLAAKNEFEPFQIVVRRDAAVTASISMTPFTGPGTVSRIEIRRVGYVRIQDPSDASSIPSGYIPDPLEPMSFGAPLALKGGDNQPFWITVYVPPDAAAGDYTSTLTVAIGGEKQDIPVSLHVFDFALPKAIGFDGNWNGSFQDLGGSESLEKVEKLKDFFHEHRLVPSSVAWPAGLNYNGGIDYDCNADTFLDKSGDYEFSSLGPKYIDGKGWNGAGFPSFEIMQFVDNKTPRPQTFCGVDRGPGAYGTPAYNSEWSKLLAAIDAYLVAHALENKGYYYVQNEPQGPEDYDIAASLCALSKSAAPHVRLAISEEPRPEIAENPKAMGRGCSRARSTAVQRSTRSRSARTPRTPITSTSRIRRGSPPPIRS
jgi:hypothetical protein